MRRVVVMGPPGSGKSTLARRLGAQHGLPVFHLDHAYWQPGWVPAAPDAFRAEVERIAALPAWVVDGNYGNTLAPRLAQADTVVFLDLPLRLTLPRVLRRTLFGAIMGRTQAPGCRERINAPFIRYVLAWGRERRSRDLALLDGFQGKLLVLTGDAGILRLADRPCPLRQPATNPVSRSQLIPTAVADDLSKEARLGSAQTRKGSKDPLIPLT